LDANGANNLVTGSEYQDIAMDLLRKQPKANAGNQVIHETQEAGELNLETKNAAEQQE